MSNQYGYSHLEILAMIVITAFSNFIMIFNLLFAIKVGIPHYIFIMTMVIVTSFMYHLSDSVGTGLLLEIGVWHGLDNIASIAGIVPQVIMLDGSFQLFHAEPAAKPPSALVDISPPCHHPAAAILNKPFSNPRPDRAELRCHGGEVGIF